MRIVCLEGCSGTGKTTHYKSLDSHYQSGELTHKSVVEKDYEPFKTAVRRWHATKGPSVPFTEADIRDFANARAETFERNFMPLSRMIDLLILDRYFYTSAVYQVGGGLSPAEILQINIDSGTPIPDLTFFLDCPPGLAFARAHARNSKTGMKPLFSTSPSMVRVIRERYLELAKRPEVTLIDTSGHKNNVDRSLIRRINYLFD